ncbi:class I SAM-dependent methyltransferase [Patescibacteria group bacterium]
MDKQTANQLLGQVKTDYDTIAEHFAHTRMNQWYEVSYLIEQYVQAGQLVLDSGCGNGRVADLVTKIKGRYIGIDVSEKLIEKARQLHPGIDFRVDDMLKTEFDDDSFDHVLMIASFHHLPSAANRLQALEEAKRIVKKSGYIVMTNWNLYQWRFVPLRWKFNLRKIFRLHQMDWNDSLVPWHDQKKHLLAKRYYHAFKPRELKHLAKQVDLSLTDQYYETNGLHVTRRKGRNLITVLQKI